MCESAVDFQSKSTQQRDSNSRPAARAVSARLVFVRIVTQIPDNGGADDKQDIHDCVA